MASSPHSPDNFGNLSSSSSVTGLPTLPSRDSLASFPRLPSVDSINAYNNLRLVAPNLVNYQDPQEKLSQLEFTKLPQPNVYPGSNVITSHFATYMERVGQPYFTWLINGLDQKKDQEEKKAASDLPNSDMNWIAKVKLVIPELYFEEDFSLEKPETFAAAFPVDSPFEEVEKKLWDHVNVIEQALVAEVTSRLDPFFSAVNIISSCQHDIPDDIDAICGLRGQVHALDDLLVTKSLRVAQLQRHRRNVANVYSKLKEMRDVRRTQPTIQSLLAMSDYAAAMDLIQKTRASLASNLAGVACFRDLEAGLEQKMGMVEKMVELEFAQLAAQRAPVSAPPSQGPPPMSARGMAPRGSLAAGTAAASAIPKSKSLFSIAGGGFDGGMTKSVSTYDVHGISRSRRDLEGVEEWEGWEAHMRLLHLLSLLTRVGRLANALDLYLDCLAKDIDLTIAQAFVALPSVAAQQNDEWPSDWSVADNMQNMAAAVRDMNHEAFIAALSSLLDALIALLKRVASVRDLLLNDLATAPQDLPPTPSEDPADPSSGSTTPNDGEAAPNATLTKVAELVNGACLVMHQRVATLVSIRSPQLSRLGYSDFRVFYDAIKDFVVASEEITKKEIVALRKTLRPQAKDFFNTLHSTKTNMLSVLLDNEPWEPTDVPQEFQDQINTWAHGIHEMPPDADSSPPGGARQQAHIGGQRFWVVNAVLILLHILAEYVQCASIPVLPTDALNAVCELLRMFNTQTRSLVMGKGAMHTAGLANLTSKHYALASQALGFVAALVPMLRIALEQNLPIKHRDTARKVEDVIPELKEHQREILDRLVNSMKDRTDVCFRTLQSWPWDSDMVSYPSDPMRNLCKDLNSFHRSLSAVLPTDQLLVVSTRIASVVAARSLEFYSKLDPSSTNGKKRASEDMAFAAASLQQLGVSADLATSLVKLRQRRFPNSFTQTS